MDRLNTYLAAIVTIHRRPRRVTRYWIPYTCGIVGISLWLLRHSSLVGSSDIDNWIHGACNKKLIASSSLLLLCSKVQIHLNFAEMNSIIRGYGKMFWLHTSEDLKIHLGIRHEGLSSKQRERQINREKKRQWRERWEWTDVMHPYSS